VIIAHSDKVEKHANQIDNFLKGIKSGWEFAKDNRDEALSIVLKYVKTDASYVRESMNRTIDFATNMYGQPVPAGHMEYAAWEKTLQTLKEAKLLTGDVDLKKAIYLR
jgi:NitT/TauT family transport system substrate-binding protein